MGLITDRTMASPDAFLTLVGAVGGAVLGGMAGGLLGAAWGAFWLGLVTLGLASISPHSPSHGPHK